MKQKIQEMNLILGVFERYFEKGIEDDKNDLDENSIKLYKSARNVCINFRHQLSDALLESIKKCTAYVLSKDPNINTLVSKIKRSGDELGYQYLTPLKNKCQTFSDILHKIETFKVNSTFEFEQLDQKKHSSVEYYFFVSWIGSGGILCTSLGIGFLIEHHLHPSSSDGLTSDWLSLVFGLAFICVAGYLLHLGEYPSIKDTMITFDQTYEELFNDISIESETVGFVA